MDDSLFSELFFSYLENLQKDWSNKEKRLQHFKRLRGLLENAINDMEKDKNGPKQRAK